MQNGQRTLRGLQRRVFAIIITIMVLELKVPHGPDLAGLIWFIPDRRIERVLDE